MLPAIRTYIVGVVLAASVFLFGVLSAFADSYSVKVVTHTQSEDFYGIDAAGDYVVNVSNSMMSPGSLCGGVSGASTCFETYYAGGVSPVFSTLAPGLSWDNGAACSKGVLSGICNNGHELLGGYLNDKKGVWAGTDTLTELLAGGSYDGGYINGSGDAVFIDGMDDTLVSVMDMPSVAAFDFFDAKMSIPDPAPVPEPASVWLVGLGIMAFGMALVRRRTPCRVGVEE